MKPKKQIRLGTKALNEIMERELAGIIDRYIDDIMKQYKTLPKSQKINAIKGIKLKGIQNYKNILLKGVSELASETIEQVKKDFAKKTSIKLEMPVEFKKLPPEVRKKLKAQLDLTIDAQVSDIEKIISFQYTDSFDTTDSENVIKTDMIDAGEEYIKGKAIQGGASAMASKAVANARTAFFFQDEVLDEVEAFRFVNGDPQSPICQDLAGTVFSKNDPEMFRYTPPLHFGCKSFIEPIYQGDLKNRKIEKLRPSKKELEKYIQFYEF